MFWRLERPPSCGSGSPWPTFSSRCRCGETTLLFGAGRCSWSRARFPRAKIYSGVTSSTMIPGHSIIARSLVDDPDLCSMCLLNVAYYRTGKEGSGSDNGCFGAARVEAAHPISTPGCSRPNALPSGASWKRRTSSRKRKLYCRATIKAMPREPEPRMSLALLLAHQGRADEARRTVDEALELIPQEQRDARRGEDRDRAARQFCGAAIGRLGTPYWYTRTNYFRTP